MATGASNCAALAANWANEVLGALHCPKVTNARNTLPVILEARWTNPVHRAQASIWAVAKNSVTFSTTPSHGSAIAVSFASLVDDNPMPSYHGGETAPSPTNSRAYLFSFMRMGTVGGRRVPAPGLSARAPVCSARFSRSFVHPRRTALPRRDHGRPW